MATQIQPHVAGRGILTMAFGQPRYIRQAIHFARSLMVTNPETPRAIVTDCPEDPGLRRYFQHVIPIRREYGAGMRQKTYVYHYSPFDETLSIDADCFALRPLDELWSAFDGKPYGMLGEMWSRNFLWLDYIDRYREVTGCKEVPAVSGGIHYFNRGAASESVAKRAMEIDRDFDALAKRLALPIRPTDENCIAFSMSEHNVTPVDDLLKRRQIGSIQFAVAKVYFDVPRCQFQCEMPPLDQRSFEAIGEKAAAWAALTPPGIYRSDIAHFYWGWDKGFHYQRETCKLRWVVDFKLPPGLASAIANALWNPPYFLFTETYRAARRAKNPRLHTPPMPCWPYSHFGGGGRERMAGA